MGDGMAGPDAQGIVVVDGSAFFRDAVCRVLAAAGHRCRGFADLTEAAPALAGPDVAVLVLDLDSTGAAGVEVFSALRAERPALQAVVLASHAGQEEVLAALRAGAADYLAKPLHEEELALSVGRALRAARNETELARLRAAAPAETGAADDADLAEAHDADLAEADDADLDLVRDLCEAVVADGDPDRVVAALLARLGEALDARGVALHRAEAGDRGFRREAEWLCRTRPARDHARLPAARGLAGAAAGTGVFVACADPAADPRFDAEVDRPAEGEPGGLLCLPLRFRGHTIALVRAFLAPGRAPSLRTAEAAGSALSAAMRSVLLYRSWRTSVDEVARIRREAGAAEPPRPPGWRAPAGADRGAEPAPARSKAPRTGPEP